MLSETLIKKQKWAHIKGGMGWGETTHFQKFLLFQQKIPLGQTCPQVTMYICAVRQNQWNPLLLPSLISCRESEKVDQASSTKHALLFRLLSSSLYPLPAHRWGPLCPLNVSVLRQSPGQCHPILVMALLTLANCSTSPKFTSAPLFLSPVYYF